MRRFNPSERRSLVVATSMLCLATAARLAFAPDGAELAWRPVSAERASTSAAATRRSVEDTLAREAESARPLAPGETIDLNRADAVQLQRLPGVGPGRAAAILRERTESGRFAVPGDLTRVPGIGPALLERWEGLLRTDGVNPPARRLPARASGVDLNQAQPKELEQITGIGPALASRIVEARVRRGRFSTMEDLLEVPGIGPKTLEKLREQAFVR